MSFVFGILRYTSSNSAVFEVSSMYFRHRKYNQVVLILKHAVGVFVRKIYIRRVRDVAREQ